MCALLSNICRCVIRNKIRIVFAFETQMSRDKKKIEANKVTQY